MARGGQWVFVPKKAAKVKVTDLVKSEMKKKAIKVIENKLKPMHIKEYPKNHEFNYIVDISYKWHQKYFYLIAKYCCPNPNAIQPFFECKFARMQYMGDDKFNLSYMRHTEKWFEIAENLTVDECLKSVAEDPYFIL